MKKVFLFVVFAASVAVANAQAKFGVKGGANLSNLTGDVDEVKMKVGFHAGGLVQIPVASGFMIQPEVVFSTQGAKEDGGDGKIKLGYVNIPVLAKYQSASGFFGETGPQLGILLSAKDEDDEDFKDEMKKTDFAWAFGLGYQTASGFGVNGRFNLGLGNIFDDSDDFKVKNSVIQLGVFYVFGGGAK